MPIPQITDKAREQLRSAVEAVYYPNGEFNHAAENILWKPDLELIYCFSGTHTEDGARKPLEAIGHEKLVDMICNLAEGKFNGTDIDIMQAEPFFNRLQAGLIRHGQRVPFYGSYNDHLDARRGSTKLPDVSPIPIDAETAHSIISGIHSSNRHPVGSTTLAATIINAHRCGEVSHAEKHAPKALSPEAQASIARADAALASMDNWADALRATRATEGQRER